MLEILGEWSKIIGAVASLATMCIALVALGSWRRTLRNQRIDEAISAAFDLAGAIERYVAVRRRGDGSCQTRLLRQIPWSPKLLIGS